MKKRCDHCNDMKEESDLFTKNGNSLCGLCFTKKEKGNFSVRKFNMGFFKNRWNDLIKEFYLAWDEENFMAVSKEDFEKRIRKIISETVTAFGCEYGCYDLKLNIEFVKFQEKVEKNND